MPDEGGMAFNFPFGDADDEGMESLFSDEIPTEEEEPSAGGPQLVNVDDEDEEEEAPPEPAEVETEETEEETEEEEEPEASSDRYGEQAYKQLQAAFTRVAMENKQLVEAQTAQQRQIQELQELQLRALAEQNPELAEQMRARQTFDQEVTQRVQQEVAPIRDQLAEQRYAAQAEQAIRGFMNDHGITQGDEADQAITETTALLMQAGVPVDISDRAHLEMVYEATQDPQLAIALAQQGPGAIAAYGAVARLRGRTGATMQPADGSPQETPTRTKPVRRRVETYVETGGTPSSQEAPSKAKDEWDEAAEWYQRRFKKGPIFGSPR